MMIGALLDELENQINEKPHLTDYPKIIGWCKVRIRQKRQIMLADHAYKVMATAMPSDIDVTGLPDSA